MKTGIQLIEEERLRQISQEGWTPEHDDSHNRNELARAAECYVHHYRGWEWAHEPECGQANEFVAQPPIDAWPWRKKDWKPKNPMHALIKAGALIAAEIDRLNRQPTQSK